jgi:glycosyltransferase involved in cell wall biosynthesis
MLVFLLKLFNKKYILVHLNPSLGIIPILRDACFLLIAKMHQVRIIVFWHGWEPKMEGLLDKRKILLKLFLIIYDNANASIVLASSFKHKMRQWGFKQTIFVETTSFDDQLTINFSHKNKIDNFKKCKKIQILYFSRLEKKKGILTTIDAFIAIKNLNKRLTLVVAGDGPEREKVNKYVKKLSDDRIKLLGYVKGDTKIKLLQDSHILCLPTSYGEGLPVSILEAMAFGIPIITSPVGGISDIFTDGVNGLYLSSLCKNDLSKLIVLLAKDKTKLIQISTENYIYAHSRFTASIVSKRIYEIYRRIYSE